MEGVASRGSVELWWERFGEPGERNFMLHSGGGDTAEVFPASFCERLADAGCCVVRFDPRDAGRSTRLGDEVAYDLCEMADDLWGVADAAGVREAVLLGYSNGGIVVQRAAIRQPKRVRGLVLLFTLARPPDLMISDDAMTALTTPAPGAGRDDPSDFGNTDLWFANATEADLAEVQRRMTPGRAPTPRSTERHMMAVMSTPLPTDEELEVITAPVLVLHSTGDCVLPHAQAPATARPYPNSTVELVDGIGHIPTERQWMFLADRALQVL